MQGKPLDHTVVLKAGGREFIAKVRDGKVILPKGLSPVPLRRSRRSGAAAKPVDLRLAVKTSTDYGPSAMTQRLVGALGSNTVAALLGVNKDRPGRWISGQDAPNEVNRLQLADLDSLVGHLLTAFTPDQARLWLEGNNAHLGGRPIDVYRLEGSAPVIEAIQAHEQGAYA